MSAIGLFLDANILALFGKLVVKMILASYSDCFLSFCGPQLSGWLISFVRKIINLEVYQLKHKTRKMKWGENERWSTVGPSNGLY